ncbi:MAG: hypothetical protein JNG85_06265 [Spirochaetaceae bacterium]|nr:hypothetical protein [Spirochaetaceae bacterium]
MSSLGLCATMSLLNSRSDLVNVMPPPELPAAPKTRNRRGLLARLRPGRVAAPMPAAQPGCC